MASVLVPLLLKRNVGVLFGVLRGPHSDAHFFSLMVLYRCDVELFPFCCVLRHLRLLKMVS
jgi:hypothetical protein